MFPMLRCILKETKISKFNEYQNSDKTSFIIYANLEYTIDEFSRFDYSKSR